MKNWKVSLVVSLGLVAILVALRSERRDELSGTGRTGEIREPGAPPASYAALATESGLNPVGLQRFSERPKLPMDGSPVEILLPGQTGLSVTVSCKTDRHQKTPDGRYDWRFTLAVSGGGVREAGEREGFTAPAAGYQDQARINMPSSLGPYDWSQSVSKIYWLRFPDETFARVGVRTVAGREPFAVLEGVWNPVPNDRGLERFSK